MDRCGTYLSRINILNCMIHLFYVGEGFFLTFSGDIKSLCLWAPLYGRAVNIHRRKYVFIRTCGVCYAKGPRSREIKYSDGHISRSQKVPVGTA